MCLGMHKGSGRRKVGWWAVSVGRMRRREGNVFSSAVFILQSYLIAQVKCQKGCE